MHPVLTHIGSWPITWFGIMMVAGFLAGYANWLWLGRKEGRDSNMISDLLFWTMVAGVAGARIAYVVSDWAYFREQPLRVFRVYEGGLIYYGGVAGALLAVLFYAAVRRERLLNFLDFVVTSLPLGHAFGRVGCFLNGCCFGKPTCCATGVRFPYGSLPWLSQRELGLIGDADSRTQPVHPVQLYESLSNLLIYVLLVFLYRRRRKEGSVLAAYLLTYPAVRFVLEFLRGDERCRVSWMPGLNVAQLVSLCMLACGAILVLHCAFARPGNGADAGGAAAQK